MDNITTLYLTDRDEWREWLKQNFNDKADIWLVYPKKSSGKARIPYNDAVEEALCFGWIDTTVKALDENHSIQRFTKRRPKSSYSQANIERLRWLFNKNMIHASIKEEIQAIISKEFDFPLDILDQIKKAHCWDNYQRFSDSYKRIRIAYIDSARKRPEEFKRRILSFINKTRENKQIKGFGGIDKHY